MTIIQTHRLTKTFVTREKQAGFKGSVRALFRPIRRETQAVKGISFTVEKGERVAFIGPNGAGKSTTIKMLVGILYPTAGSAEVLGKTPWRCSPPPPPAARPPRANSSAATSSSGPGRPPPAEPSAAARGQPPGCRTPRRRQVSPSPGSLR
jgi:ABC-type uncharacterized transport system ATPase subunit